MISITLPSVHPAQLERALENIARTTHNVFEVIVVSPEPPQSDSKLIRWIVDLDNAGPNIAHERAAAAARGQFVLGWVDDHLLLPHWDIDAIALLKAAEEINEVCVLGLRQIDVRHVGTVFGRYYPYFPFARRSTIKRIGWLREYRRGFADCDLGLRVWAAKGYTTWSAPSVLRCADDSKHLVDHEAVYTPDDLTRFLKRWGHTFGQGWSTNVVRDFNIDVIPEELRCTKNGTINVNSPLELWS